MHRALFIFAAFAIVACGSKKPTAAEVCSALEKAGEVKSCAAATPGGIGAGASAKAQADLPSAAGKTCQILQFASPEAYDGAAKAFEGAAMLVGPHRYGNREKLVYVQCSSELAADHGAKIKGVVDAL